MTKELIQSMIDGVTAKPVSSDPKATACPFCGGSSTPSTEKSHRDFCWPRASELDHDPGGRYNADGTFPQT